MKADAKAKRTRSATTTIADDRQREDLQRMLGTAVEELVSYTGSDRFFATFTSDSGQTYYLLFGSPQTLRDIMEGRLDSVVDATTRPTIH